MGEIGRSWLLSAKIARKAGHWQTAYSAMLHAQESQAPLSFVQTAKLIKANSEPLRALKELDNSMRAHGFGDQADVIDLTEDTDETKLMKAKVTDSVLSAPFTFLIVDQGTSYSSPLDG